jgi:transcriptional regulator with XRE-family HTH domain
MATSSTSGKAKLKHPALVAFGEAVRRRRKDKGFSQEAFGDACGIDRSYMGGIERGEHNLALVNIIKIVRALDVLPSEFFLDLDEVEETETVSTAKTRTSD